MVTINKGSARLTNAAHEKTGATNTGQVSPTGTSTREKPFCAATNSTAKSKVAGTA